MTTAATSTDKVADKVIEKRRALGRGVGSLLPSGPRMVDGGNARVAPAPHGPGTQPGILPEVHAQAAARGEAVVEISLALIDENPYQTRYFAKDEPVSD